MLQRTIKNEIRITGVGLHSGERVKLHLKKANVDEGILFRRIDLKGNQSRIIKLHPNLINDTRLSSTVVTEDNIRVGTIEHLMSAFCALGIDNVLVELDAPEIPIMDGSSLPFIHVIREGKIVEQKKEKVFIKVKKTIELKENDKWVKILPFDGFKTKLSIYFNHPVFNKINQSFEIDFSQFSYLEEIARARTFGFIEEVELMKLNNLGLGGNLNNAIVVDSMDVLNPEGLRYSDEFARHKILDAIGDLYVSGHQIIGFFEGFKSGHDINNKILRKLLSDDNNFEYVSFTDNKNLPSSFHYVPEYKKN